MTFWIFLEQELLFTGSLLAVVVQQTLDIYLFLLEC